MSWKMLLKTINKLSFGCCALWTAVHATSDEEASHMLLNPAAPASLEGKETQQHRQDWHVQGASCPSLQLKEHYQSGHGCLLRHYETKDSPSHTSC